MYLNTRRLFLDLLRDLAIDRVCDVGSMDGSDALAFRKRLPHAAITAFEPNPLNLCAMRADPRLDAARIEVVAAAASDHEGNSPFYLVPADSRDRRGHSSLLRRGLSTPQEEVTVRTLRLDAALAAEASVSERIALWIDVEGKAYEVIEGIRGLAPRVRLIHVEVESELCIGAGQRLYPEVDALLNELGFEQIATDMPTDWPQFNALYIRRGQDGHALQWRLRRARARRALSSAVQRICPQFVRRLTRWRERHVTG